MVEQGLIDFIKSQSALGTKKEEIKKALIGAGWAATDIENAFGSIAEPSATAVTEQKTIPPGSDSSNNILLKFGVISTAIENPQGSLAVASAEQKKADTIIDAETAKKAGFNFRKFVTPTIVLSILLVLSLAANIYLYIQNSSSQKNLGAPAVSSVAPTSSPDPNLAAITKERDSLILQLADAGAKAKAQIESLSGDISFFAIASGTNPTTPINFTARGMLSGGGKTPYVIMLENGIKLIVVNSKAADPLLKPLLNSVVEVAGTHLPGSNNVTLTIVSGIPVSN